MIVDLHVHTFPASTCSSIAYRDLIAWCSERDMRAIALTNHGSVEDNRRLEEPLAEMGVVLIHGVEISTLYGDFLVYSADLDYLAGFKAVDAFPGPDALPPDAALVWAHPAAGGGRSASAYYDGLADLVAPGLDAVEVWNGNWDDGRSVATARRIADDLGLPATGGSDAHRTERIGRCATEIGGEINTTADVVAAIKAGAVTPVPPQEPARGLSRVFGRLGRRPERMDR
jgi:predicted metal-dependent phosphoesterase TrpH